MAKPYQHASLDQLYRQMYRRRRFKAVLAKLKEPAEVLVTWGASLGGYLALFQPDVLRGMFGL